MKNLENLNSKIKINSVTNRFLPINKSVLNGLEPEPKLSDFEMIKPIGKGSFGNVIHVRHKQTMVEYAIKIINKQDKANLGGKPYFRREIEIMYKLHHPNCVKLYGHFEDENCCYFIMEYLPNGNLYHFMKTRKKLIETSHVASIMKDLISAVYYLHNMIPPIIHRDIKPENILLSENGTIKLTDFGWSNYIEYSGEERMTFCGTPLYLAPEMLMRTGHDCNVDIWCVGVLLFELLSGRPPFIAKDKPTLMENIIKGKINWSNINIDDDGKNLIEMILKKDPKMRPSLKEIINHRFFKKYWKNPEEFLIKGNDDMYLNDNIYIISKDSPNMKFYDKKKNENNVRNVNQRKRVISKRDISPVPGKRPYLDKIKNNNNNNINTIDNDIEELKKSKNSNKDSNKHSSSILQIELSSLKKNYENLTSTISLLEKESIKNFELIENHKNYISKLEKENEIKEKEIKKKDLEINRLKEKSKKNENHILKLQLKIENLKKEINSFPMREKVNQRPRTPDNVLYKKKNVNTNTIHQLSTNINISTNQILKNSKIIKIDDKLSPKRNRNNQLRMSKSTSNIINYGKNRNDTFDRKINRINGILKNDY